MNWGIFTWHPKNKYPSTLPIERKKRRDSIFPKQVHVLEKPDYVLKKIYTAKLNNDVVAFESLSFCRIVCSPWGSLTSRYIMFSSLVLDGQQIYFIPCLPLADVIRQHKVTHLIK
jgi:hypothetical protein